MLAKVRFALVLVLALMAPAAWCATVEFDLTGSIFVDQNGDSTERDLAAAAGVTLPFSNEVAVQLSFMGDPLRQDNKQVSFAMQWGGLTFTAENADMMLMGDPSRGTFLFGNMGILPTTPSSFEGNAFTESANLIMLFRDPRGTDMSLSDLLAANLLDVTVNFNLSGAEGFDYDGAFESGKLTASLREVPLPAAFWLFGSVLAGLFGFSRLRQASTVRPATS